MTFSLAIVYIITVYIGFGLMYLKTLKLCKRRVTDDLNGLGLALIVLLWPFDLAYPLINLICHWVFCRCLFPALGFICRSIEKFLYWL